MKVKLATLYATASALHEIANTKLNIKTAVKINCLLKDLEKYFSAIAKERNKLLNELGEKNENGNMQLKPGEKRKPILPEYGNTESRLQDARSKNEIAGANDTSEPFNWKEAQSKKKS